MQLAYALPSVYQPEASGLLSVARQESIIIGHRKANTAIGAGKPNFNIPHIRMFRNVAECFLRDALNAQSGARRQALYCLVSFTRNGDAVLLLRTDQLPEGAQWTYELKGYRSTCPFELLPRVRPSKLIRSLTSDWGVDSLNPNSAIPSGRWDTGHCDPHTCPSSKGWIPETPFTQPHRGCHSALLGYPVPLHRLEDASRFVLRQCHSGLDRCACYRSRDKIFLRDRFNGKQTTRPTFPEPRDGGYSGPFVDHFSGAYRSGLDTALLEDGFGREMGTGLGNIVSEWTQLLGLVLLTKRLMEEKSKASKQ
jgi:hypothetical protein